MSSAPEISHLKPIPPHQADPAPVSIKLTSDLLNQLKTALHNGTRAKLVVKDGQYSIKVEAAEYPCPAVSETSRIDIYSEGNCTFKGRIATRLNVLTDPKSIKDYLRRPPPSSAASMPTPSSSFTSSSAALHPHSANTPTPTPTPLALTPVGSGDYASGGDHHRGRGDAAAAGAAADGSSRPPSRTTSRAPLRTTSPTHYASPEEPLAKFLYFSALGPATIRTLCSSLTLQEREVSAYLAQYSQVYNPNDSFIVDDIYARSEHTAGTTGAGASAAAPTYILKDKSYKELKPWSWAYYTDDERSLVIHNAHNALTRLGYSETHPLRRKITERPSSSEEDGGAGGADGDASGASPVKRNATLGGGLLKSRTKVSPVKRSSTVSPRPPSVGPLPSLAGTSASASGNGNGAGNSSNGNASSLRNTRPNSSMSTSYSANGAHGAANHLKRKLSTSSTSSSDDEKPLGTTKKHRKTVRGRTSSSGGSTSSTFSTASANGTGASGSALADSYTSPSSINEESEQEPSPPSISILPPPPSHGHGHGGATAPATAPASAANTPSSHSTAQFESKSSKKLQFYNNIALKFKLRYKEYEELYKTLYQTSHAGPGAGPGASAASQQEKRRNITRLFELHNQLSEWKRKLWDYDNESKTKSNIMTLQKHKKTPALPTGPANGGGGGGGGVPASFLAGVGSTAIKSQSLSPSIPHNSGAVKRKPDAPKLPVKPAAFKGGPAKPTYVRTLDY